MGNLPADIITNILSYLPVPSLLQFRSTSKSWRALIDSDHFKNLHLRKSKSTLNLILGDYSKLYNVDLPTLRVAINLNQPPLKSAITIMGSCNGLLCIKNLNDIITIWSPPLRKHWILPPLQTSLLCTVCGYGFGFDRFTRDYKVVKISYFFGVGDTFKSKVNLFSCKANKWKTLGNIPYALSRSKTTGALVDHALHWVVVKGNHTSANLIVAFDFKFGVFNEVPLPELGEGFEIDVSNLRGCLSMIVNYRKQNTEICIWVMKQYGSKDSWFKLFTLMDSLELRFLEFVKPLCYFDDKVLFKQDTKNLLWYNLKSKQMIRVTIPEIPKFVDAIIWVESLVQPPFPNGIYRKQ